MGKNKIIKYLFIFVSIIFLNLSYVKALQSTYGPITQVGNKEYDTNYFTSLKIANDKAIFCTSFNDKAPILQTCQINTGWDERTRYAVASIIKKANTGITITGMTTEYFAAELAINGFLNSIGAGGAPIAVDLLSNTYQSTYTNYFETAKSTYNNYGISINTSTSNLTFSLNGSRYESNLINVEGVDINKEGTSITSNVGTVSKSGNGFKIIVEASEITKATTINVEISANKEFDQARNYSCGTYTEDNVTKNYQTITPNTVDKIIKQARKSISGTINPFGKLIINKVDGDKKPLSGATIKVTGRKGYNKTFESNGTPIIIENLQYDTYTIEETEAPSGYMNNTTKTAILSSTNPEATVELINTKIKTTFSKLDATGKKELPGAFLEIQDKDGKVVKLCPGTEEEKYIECSWVSAQIPYVVEGLPIGKYYLVETIAPEGYVLSKEKVMFEITGKEANVKVEMKNLLNKVIISKKSLVTKKELPGATLEIQDKNGKVVEFCTDSKGLKNKPCTWTSGDKPYEINGMPNGTYYLVETIAPEGYVLNKEKVKFIVDGNKSIVEVEMKNELEVKVPDTLSSRSVLLIVISMFDIALGIGIINYVKKNKIQE